MIRNLQHTPSTIYVGQYNAVYAKHFKLQPGDRIIEPIFQTGILKHHSIYLGVDEYGNEWISENQKGHGVRLVKASEFFRPGKEYQTKGFNGTQNERVEAVKRALKELGKSYDLVSHNCEHYASYVQSEKPESTQVNALIGLSLAALVVGLFAATE